MGNPLGAHPDLFPPRLHQSRDLGRGRDRRAARIVAVEALAVVQEILRLVVRTEDEIELGRGDVRARRPGICGVVAVDAGTEEILAHARDSAEGVGPLQRVLVVEPHPGLRDLVRTHRLELVARCRAVQGHVDVVAARVKPELVGHLPFVPFAVEDPTGRQADDGAVVRLLELIAHWKRIVEEECEVGKQVQPVFDRVYIHVEHRAVR